MFNIKRIWLIRDKKLLAEWIKLVEDNNLTAESQLDYTIGIFDEDKLIGTASLYKNIIKCVAICKDYTGNNLLAKMVTYLLDYLNEKKIFHVFLYTKPELAYLFKSLGFNEIVKTEQVIFMEMGYPDFMEYEYQLKKIKKNVEVASSIVMNANPFTLGHLHLIEEAAKQSDWVYCFIVSEDSSEFTTEERINLVKQGCASVGNVTILPTEQYQVSSATFPSYFLKEHAKADVSAVQAKLDARLFRQSIAPILDIKKRFVGDEPYSEVTNIYNNSMKKEFGDQIELIVLDRLTTENEVISATKVREAFQKNDFETIKIMVPKTTYDYLLIRGETKWKSKKQLQLGR